MKLRLIVSKYNFQIRLPGRLPVIFLWINAWDLSHFLQQVRTVLFADGADTFETRELRQKHRRRKFGLAELCSADRIATAFRVPAEIAENISTLNQTPIITDE